MLRYLMQSWPVPPTQTLETWKEWARVQQLDADITFIRQALWRKLSVGTRLAGWQPQRTACPLDTQHEASQHALLHCRYLPVAFRLATQCMGPVRVDDGTTDHAEEILSSMPALSLSSPLDLVMWSAVRTNWRMRCLHKFGPIPKVQGSISVQTLRPICLQNVIFKWASAMEDTVAFAPPNRKHS